MLTLSSASALPCLNCNIYFYLRPNTNSGRFDLGEVAPQANGIKVYHQDSDDKDQILMDVDFSWVGEQDVQLQIKPLPKHLGPLSPAGALLSAIVHLRVCPFLPKGCSH